MQSGRYLLGEKKPPAIPGLRLAPLVVSIMATELMAQPAEQMVLLLVPS
jgi:hypothetical protein